ncbi:MAG: hypothetical protein HQ548_01700 [Chloroflexi bacterium]|nr:hypothetical protein [Chloroflexota bacterium]
MEALPVAGLDQLSPTPGVTPREQGDEDWVAERFRQWLPVQREGWRSLGAVFGKRGSGFIVASYVAYMAQGHREDSCG